MVTAGMALATAHLVGKEMTAPSALALQIALATGCATTALATVLMVGVELTAHNVSFVQTIAQAMDAAKTSLALAMTGGWVMTAR